MIIWFTGLSGAGKSTLAEALSARMKVDGIVPLIIDGDVLRSGLASDLGFTEEDRSENVRRAAWVAVLAAKSGISSICSLISPLRKDREIVRAIAQAQGVPFFEVFVDTPLEVCEQRDPKGLYKKARLGQIPNFTGISAPYECPLDPELVVKTAELSVIESLRKIYVCVSGLDTYEKSSRSGWMERLLAKTLFRVKMLCAGREAWLGGMASSVIPGIYWAAVLVLDVIAPIKVISLPLFAVGMMVCSLTIPARKMFFWATVYVSTSAFILFCRPFYRILNNGQDEFDLVFHGVRWFCFLTTAVFSCLVAHSLARLRDKVGGLSRLLVPRVYRIGRGLE